MARPADFPEWGMNNTATEITEPSAADKLTGWVPDEQPGAQHMNWILYTIYTWLFYLDETNDDEEFSVAGAAGNGTNATYGNGTIVSATVGNVVVPFKLPLGSRLKSAHVTGLRTGANDPIYYIYEMDNATGVETQLATVNGTSASIETLDMAAINHTIVVDKTYYLRTVGGVSSTHTVYNLQIKWDRP